LIASMFRKFFGLGKRLFKKSAPRAIATKVPFNVKPLHRALAIGGVALISVVAMYNISSAEDKKSEVELVYFPVRGLAEVLRLTLVAANVDFKERAVNSPQVWEQVKTGVESPYKQVPVLKIDGQNLVQSKAIQNYVATKYGLRGSNLIEAYQSDALVEAASDANSVGPFAGRTPPDEKKVKEYFEKFVPRYFPVWESQLKANGGRLVGKKLTIGDLAVYNHIRLLKENAHVVKYDFDATLKPYPALLKFYHETESIPAIATYLKSSKCLPAPTPADAWTIVDKAQGK